MTLSYSQFRRSLKTFLFGKSDHCALWTLLPSPGRNILTYLLTYFYSLKDWTKHLRCRYTRQVCIAAGRTQFLLPEAYLRGGSKPPTVYWPTDANRRHISSVYQVSRPVPCLWHSILQLFWSLGPVEWMSLKFKWHLRSFCVTHYVIFVCVLRTDVFLILFVRCIQNDVRDDVMRDAKWSKVSNLNLSDVSKCNRPLIYFTFIYLQFY